MGVHNNFITKNEEIYLYTIEQLKVTVVGIQVNMYLPT